MWNRRVRAVTVGGVLRFLAVMLVCLTGPRLNPHAGDFDVCCESFDFDHDDDVDLADLACFQNDCDLSPD